MALVQDRCICLRRFPYSETSQILSLFSRDHGLVRVIAKGAHRKTKAGGSKFDGGVDLLDAGQAVFTHDPGRDLATLTEWSLDDGHRELRQSLRGLYLGQYAAELVSLLFEEHDPHPQVFDRLEATLGDLAGPRLEEAFLAFELDVLREAGYLSELSHCTNCGSAVKDGEPSYFSASQGGLVCRNCEGVVHDRVGLDGRLLRLIRTMMQLPRVDGAAQRLPQLTRHQTDPLNRLLAGQVEHTLGKRLRMGPYVLGVS